jgi:hypothetical protein
MPTTVTIDSVTTEDAAPAVAPHRISRQASKTDVTVKFTATHDGNIVPSYDLLPGGTLFPDEDWYPDEGYYPDQGAIVPGVPRDIIAWEIRLGGSDRSSGKLVAQDKDYAGVARAASTRAITNPEATAQGLRLASGTQITTTFTFTDADDGGADGSRTVNVYVLTEGQGWT